MSSDEEEGRIGFEVTEEDEENEFFRGHRKQTKEEILYGVFADDMDGGAKRTREKAPSAGRGRGAGGAPMMFVKSGSTGAGFTGAGEAVLDSDDEDAATNREILDGVSAEADGGQTSDPPTDTAAAAAAPSSAVPEAPHAKVFAPPKVRTADPFADGQAKKLGKAPAFGGAGAATDSNAALYSSFGRRPDAVTKVVRDKSYAGFEKHTKGIGMKLLQKMGWTKGQGLGKGKQGMLRPVDTIVRKRGAGLQDEGERTEQAKQDMPNKADEEKRKEVEHEEEIRQWQVNPNKASRAKKPKYSYKTAEEIAAEGAAGAAVPTEASTIKVVDMRGPEARVYTGYDQMGRQTATATLAAPTGVGCRELVHNVGVYVDLATSDVQQVSSKLRKEERHRLNLKEEGAKMSVRVRQEQGYLRRLTEILEVVEHCRSRSASTDSQLDLEEVTQVLGKLKRSYPKEYEVYGLAKLAGALLLPVMKAEFAGWEPLVEPSRCTSVVRTCRGILEDDGVGVTAEGIETMSLYETLCWEHVVPHLRTALGRWNTRDVLPAIELVETWEALLPGWMTTSVLEQVVMPKLVAGVDDWSPTSEATPVHSWLHPWLPLFGKEAMTPLYPPIRFKLASALQSGGWHPQDQSALAMVAPWKGVFTAKETARFLDRCVTPKLVAVLRDELQVNPNAQDVNPLKWVLAWAELYSATALGGMIDTHLARKLLRALAQWLSAESRSYIEVLEWYCGWKRLIGHALGATPPLRRLFARAADMLNRAALVELGHPNPPRKRVADTARPTVGVGGASVGEAQAAKRARGGAASSTRIPGDLGSVRDLVHKLADERGLTFMPKAGRTTEDGSQLYSLGGLTMFMDRGVIHARRSKGEYNPVSIDELMALATAH